MFALTDFDRSLVAMLESTAIPGRFAAKSAVRHIDKAYSIAAMDPEMAAFRAITAEEEAATALFHSLKRRRYPGSELLKPRDHLQKNAVAPFCSAVASLFAAADQEFDLRPQLAVVGEGPSRKLETRFHVGGLGLGDRVASPQPPLNLEIRSENQLHDFGEQLRSLAEDRNASSIVEHLRKRANLRNEILYASVAGVPTVTLGDLLEKQRAIVKGCIELFLLIDPHAEHQRLVSQALRAFLQMLGRLPERLAF